VIGSRVTTQTISWDEEIKLIDGILFDIDFDQDFSAVYLNSQPITDIPATSIIEFLSNPKSGSQKFDGNTPIRYAVKEDEDFWKMVDKYEKKEKKLEKKWKKDKPKRKKTLKRILKWINDSDKLRKKGW